MDIRISPSKLGNRYVLGRAGKDIRNITGSFRIDKFAEGIISKYEKTEETDLPRTQMELLKRPELPEPLADIQDIINELLIINRSHTDITNSLFRNISIENNILRIDMLLSKLETSNEYKQIKQELENIYRMQMQAVAAEAAQEGGQLELPLGVMPEEQLVERIETILREGGIHSSEMVERIMGPAEREVRTERDELIRQPEYIPMNITPLSQWKSPEAKNFFWRVQRLEKQDREMVLKSLGNISLSRLERILSEMDSETWHTYAASIAEKIKVYLASPEAQETGNKSLMAEPVPAENYYSQLLEILGNEEELTPEMILEEKENLIRFLEREDTDTERIRTEVVRILNSIHRDSVFTPSVPDKKKELKDEQLGGDGHSAEATVIEESPKEAGVRAGRKAGEEDKEELIRKRAINRVIKDIEEMDIAEFSVLYDRILRNAGEMPKDIVERLIPSLRVEGIEVTDEEIEIDRRSILNFLKKTQTETGYYSDILLRNIVRASDHRMLNQQRATEIAETTMNLSVAEWKQFTTEIKNLSKTSELSRRYLQAAEEAKIAAQKAQDSGIEGADHAKTLSPEMREQVESTKEKMIFITQLDKAFKEGIDIYEEGDIITEQSIFSQYIHKREGLGGFTEMQDRPKTDERVLVEYLTRNNLRTLVETINQRITEREEREALARREINLIQKEESIRTREIESILEERELIHPELRVRMLRSSMEPMLEEIQAAGPAQAAVDQAISYLEKRRDARTGETVVREEILTDAPVELVTMRKNEPASREEIEEIKKTTADTKKQLDENTTDIQYLKGGVLQTEVTNESRVDMKSLHEKLTVQENEIERIRAIQEQMIRAEKKDSYYTQKTINKVNEQLRMEKLRRGL